ncbi:hypothetical protein [Pedobacter duraquae]|uniref:Lipoprotein n=1 Tax=Pedobacter duraquae TaxID=425511 RepID=A0A4R6IDR3_9SPHI|nr:hypothetical protein [Pedobacter duraquae]TDO19045.1 hypothetical protein CLV32_4667 [Pedobacter duraquae]
MRIPWFLCLFLLCISCTHKEAPTAAFYYWKTVYQPDRTQKELLAKAGDNNLYLRFFDVTWDEQLHHAQPNAVTRISANLKTVNLTPVIFITNRVFERLQTSETDSLAKKCSTLISQMVSKANCTYRAVQVDCDWTDTTKDKYFAFLKAFQLYNKHSLQATIRLHQVKYRERTGVPPVNKGVLMYYNMGKISSGQSRSSIFNEQDAAKYLGRLSTYPLPLDVALPLFSWVIHSRNGKVIQVYTQISRNELTDSNLFEHITSGYRARTNFFMKGVYIKKNDIFKPEETNMEVLQKAAGQLADQLPPLHKRTIIYYELATISLPEFTPQAIHTITHRF